MRKELQGHKDKMQENIDEFVEQIGVALPNEKVNRQLNIDQEEQAKLKAFALEIARRKVSQIITQMNSLIAQAEQGKIENAQRE